MFRIAAGILVPLALVTFLGAVPAYASGERESPPRRMPREELVQSARAAGERVPVGWQPASAPSLAALSWTALGPRPIADEYWSGNDKASGRVSSIVVDPRDADVAYVAAAQGGVWKTTDGGASWAPLTDDLSSLASGALALDPVDPDIVYYATGEQHESGDSFYGDGLFKSTNGGATWAKIASRASIGAYVSRIAVNRGNSSILHIASSRGLLRSIDGGVNWSVTQSGDWGYDLAPHPTDSNVLYGAMYDFGVYQSVDAGATWTLLAGGLPASGFQRVQIALAPADPDVLYASFVAPGGSLLGLYRTENGGATWSVLPATPNYLGFQGWYDNCLIVDPSDADVCYAGGMFPYGFGDTGVIRTANGGASWVDITFATDGTQVHPDQHIFAFGPDGTLWLGNDGGVWKTDDPGGSWTNCNDGLAITQFYTLALHPTNPNLLIGGTQDNGSLRYEGTDLWPQVVSGDGGPCAFEWDSPNIYYTTYVFMNPLFQWDDGAYLDDVTGGWNGVDRASWCSGPLVVDPNLANTLLVGTYRVWRSTDSGSGWNTISGDLTSASGVLLGIAVAEGVASTYYATTSNGRVLYTNDGGANWLPRHSGLPQRAIQDIVVSPTNPLSATLCSDTLAGGRVWTTADAGVSWTNISGDLPNNVRGLCLTADHSTAPPAFYLGTDVGLFSSVNGGTTWMKETSGFPSSAVFDVAVDEVNDYVVAATHGRGMFRASVATVSVAAGSERASWLRPVAPNPTRPPVLLQFQLPEPAEVSLAVYDLAGRRVRELITGPRDAGRFEAIWDGRDANGAPTGGGVYFYRLRSGARSESRRFVLLR
ncbi:MAG TPA: FlgD immunoglobulin-like domain containing protein [Candidatus Limnocylindria bacterium]|nr:FlgD immunoglobulin-like domain containing protein [Candidatus Limnocylindria bacterium]